MIKIKQYLGDESDPEAAVFMQFTKGSFQRFLNIAKAAGWKAPVEKKAPAGSDEGFPEFESAYPRQEAIYGAKKIWREQGLAEFKDAILAHVEKMKNTPDWLKNGGMYVPYPVKYLSERRWEGAQEPDDMTGVK